MTHKPTSPLRRVGFVVSARRDFDGCSFEAFGNEKGQHNVLAFCIWCPGEDSNLHGVTR
jgi:hypothetical protein